MVTEDAYTQCSSKETHPSNNQWGLNGSGMKDARAADACLRDLGEALPRGWQGREVGGRGRWASQAGKGKQTPAEEKSSFAQETTAPFLDMGMSGGCSHTFPGQLGSAWVRRACSAPQERLPSYG